jgi:hypothetical protein
MFDDSEDLIDRAIRYLQLCGERRLKEASTYLAPMVALTFPGPRQFVSLEEMVANATRWYRDVRKANSSYSAGHRISDDCDIVIATGTLHGTRLDGVAFDGIRYLDMLVFRDGLIIEQHVFNDLAQVGVLT